MFSPTLAGVGKRVDENRERQIDLTTHVDEVLDLFEREDLRDVVLCGHSYGGMVIAGVADRVPDRIGNLVFLDAVVPENGACMTDYVFPGWRLLMVITAVWLLGRGRTLLAPKAKFFGVNKADRAMVDRRLTPHPAASLRERIKLGNGSDLIPHHTYVYGTEWRFFAIDEQYRRAKARSGWQVFEIKAGHDIMIDAPERLAEVLVELP